MSRVRRDTNAVWPDGINNGVFETKKLFDLRVAAFEKRFFGGENERKHLLGAQVKPFANLPLVVGRDFEEDSVTRFCRYDRLGVNSYRESFRLLDNGGPSPVGAVRN